MFNLGPFEIIVILVVVLIIFGPGKLPMLGGALGKGISEFRKSVTGKDDEALNPPSKESVEKIEHKDESEKTSV
jgi:sec-independent protein translocase protein TatA